MKKPLYKRAALLTSEEGESIHEVIMDKRKIKDGKPVQLAVAILHHSKLLLLKFVHFLRTFLVKGSYAIVYGGM